MRVLEASCNDWALTFSTIDPKHYELTRIDGESTETIEFDATSTVDANDNPFPVPPPEARGKWVMARNRDNGIRIAILLRSVHHGLTADLSLKVARLMVIPSETGELGTSDVSGIRLTAIASAYSRVFAEGSIIVNRKLLLINPRKRGIPEKYGVEKYGKSPMCIEFAYPPKNILDPLPADDSRHDWFYALVGEQYVAIANEYPDMNTAAKMVDLNASVAKPSTVRRWIAQARKRGLLPPADWKRGQ